MTGWTRSLRATGFQWVEAGATANIPQCTGQPTPGSGPAHRQPRPGENPAPTGTPQGSQTPGFGPLWALSYGEGPQAHWALFTLCNEGTDFCGLKSPFSSIGFHIKLPPNILPMLTYIWFNQVLLSLNPVLSTVAATNHTCLLSP